MRFPAKNFCKFLLSTEISSFEFWAGYIALRRQRVKVPIRPKFSNFRRCSLIVLWDSQILRCSLIVFHEFRIPESTLFWTVFRAFPPWKLQKMSKFFSRASRAKFSKFRRCLLIVLWDSHIFRRCLVVRGGLLIVIPWYSKSWESGGDPTTLYDRNRKITL